MPAVRILLLSDTHIGFDSPRRERVVRRRRGPDFQASFERALEPALRREVDLVVHAGDLFHRSRVCARVAEEGLGPLRAVAERGVPVFLLPGNHERSRIPFPLFAAHPNLHVFHEPTTFVPVVRGVRVAIAGLPYVRRVGVAFRRELWRTRFHESPADVRLLCLHQAIEGARVGPAEFTFRPGRDVITGADLPSAFDAVLVGHIHRHQVLTHDLRRQPLPAPVFFCGSTERTSFAEEPETKGALHIEVRPGTSPRWRFLPLPTRPMRTIPLVGGPGALERLRRALAGCPADAVVRIALQGAGAPPSSAEMRALAPSMNLSLSFGRDRR
ncbi:MAG: DNA repair exonuclease [Myxococcota bacterium]|nr:DNA repair exonuclease [Myxococcota bacterium]